MKVLKNYYKWTFTDPVEKTAFLITDKKDLQTIQELLDEIPSKALHLFD